MSSESFFSKIAAFLGFKKSSGSNYAGRPGSNASLLKLYVGNLSYDVTDEDLRKAFEPHGRVTSAQVVRDRHSNQSKGFGFVEMSNRSEIQAAIRALNGEELKGRAINVNEARPRPEGSQGQGGGNGRGGFRRSRGGFRGRRGGRSSSSQQMD
jgi:cold-inducible RNA-binding protein